MFNIQIFKKKTGVHLAKFQIVLVILLLLILSDEGKIFDHSYFIHIAAVLATVKVLSY